MQLNTGKTISYAYFIRIHKSVRLKSTFLSDHQYHGGAEDKAGRPSQETQTEPG